MPNNFSDAISTNGALDMTKLRASLWSSSSENPEQATKQLSIARDLKVPVEVVKADPEELKRQKAYEALDFDAILRNSPNLANTLQDTNKSSALHDDVVDLSKYESNVLRDPNLSDYAADLPAGGLKGVGSSLSGWAELDRSWRRFGIRMYDKFGIEHPSYESTDIYAKLLKGAGESIKSAGDSLTDPDVELTTGRQIAQGIGQIGPQIATTLISPPLAIASFTGQGADIMSDVAKEKGQYGTPQGDLATVGGAAVTGITEKLGIDLLLGKLPPSIKQGIVSNVVKALEKIGLQNATLKAVATVGGTIALKAAGEATQEATEQTLQNKITQFLLDPTVKTFEGVGQSAKVGGGVGATVASILQLIAGRKNKVKTITNPSTPEEANINYNIEQTTIAEHVKQIQENKTFQRDPQLFSDVHESTLGQKDVYVNAEKINEYFQKLGDDGSQLEAFLESMPKAKEQYTEALSLGGDIILPANEALVKLAQENNPELNKLVKLSPTSMTDEDYTAHLDNRVTPEFEASTLNEEQATQHEALVQKFYDKYKEGTKFDKVARNNAEMTARFFTTRRINHADNPEFLTKLDKMANDIIAQKGIVNPEGALNQVIKVPLPDNSGLETLVYRDPTPGQIVVQFRRSKRKQLRWVKDKNGNLYTWDAFDLTHRDAMTELNIEYVGYDDNGYIIDIPGFDSGTFNSEQEASYFVKAHMKDRTKSYNQLVDTGGGLYSGDIDNNPWILDDERFALKAIYNNPQNESQINSPEFKKWFGESKIVDKNNKPMVMFHGSKSDNLDAFVPFSHFGSIRAAHQRLIHINRYIEEMDYQRVMRGGKSQGEVPKSLDGNVTPVYLSIKNPLKITDKDGNLSYPREIAKTLYKNRSITKKELDSILYKSPEEYRNINKLIDDKFGKDSNSSLESDRFANELIDKILIEKTIKLLESKGFDGFKYKNTIEDPGHTSYMIFHPEQVKSIFNKGSFNPNDSKILYQKTVSPAFYSTLEKTVTDSKQTKATPEQWLNTIKNTPGIKEEELVDSGLLDFLNQVSKQNKSTTKEDDNSLSESVTSEQVKQLEVATTKALAVLNKAEDKVRVVQDKFKAAIEARGGTFNSKDQTSYQKDYGRMKEFKAWKSVIAQRDKVKKVYSKLTKDKKTGELNLKNIAAVKEESLKIDSSRIKSFIEEQRQKSVEQTVNSTLSQKANEEVRGSVLFQKLNGSIKSIISLFEKENKSTLLHESAHVFLEIYKTLAEDPDAPKEFVDEFNAIRAELGLKPGEEIQTKHHEMWARAFEQYVRTGKAPSIELQSTFQTFKSWLVRIYKSALELNVKVSPELSVLFDRMLATDEQIEMMRNSSLFRPDPNISKLLTKAEQADYVRRNEKVLEAAKEHLLRKAIKQKEREKKAEWNTQRESIKKEITTQVQQEPVQQAMHFLKKGTLLGKETPKEIIPLKLSRSDVKSKLSDEDFKRISAGILSSDGVPTEVISDMFGFKDAQDMLAQIKDAPSFKDRVNQLTDEEMTRRNGDMLNDGSIEQEALASLHSADRADFINYEIGVLSRKANQLQATKEEIKAKAIALINKTPINKLRPDLFYNAEVRAAREVGNALAKKNYIKAADEKGKQLLNHYAYRAALEAKKNLIRSEKLFKKVFGNDAKIASLRNIDMVEAARSLLSKFGYGKADISQLNRFLKTIEDNPQFFERLAPVEAANEIVQQDYDKMTPDDLNTLLEGVQNLWHLARQDKQIEIDGKKVAKDQAVAELKEQFVKTSTIREHGKKHAVRKKESMTMVGLSLLAALRRVESWVSKVDGVKFLGPVRRYIYTPISEACNQYRLVRQETLIKYRQILAPVEKTLTNKVIPGPELGYDFDTKAELLGALLHTGNESNLKKLLLGRGWASIKEDGTLDTSRWDRFISRLRQEGVLTKVDYDYAQGVWDLFEEIKGPLQKAWKAVYGFYFKEIKAKSFKTPFGEYRGGYVPATPDSILSAKAEQRNEKESIMQTNSSFSFPSTSRSMTKARNDKVAVPLLMDLRMVTQHIDAVLRLAYIQPAVNQVYSLINRGDFRDVLDSSNRAIMSGMLIPWLKRAVTQSVTTPATSRAGKIVDRVSTILRKRTGMSTMILNIPNIIQQYTGISIAATKVRRSLLNAALITYSRQPTDTHANMVEKSLFMRQNTDLQMTEISNQIEDLVLNPNKFQKVVNFGERNGYVLQQITQNQVNVVVWTAAYTQYLEEHNDDLNAVRFADSVIRETQGSFNPESISESESGRAFYRVFTMFYSYFNMQANLLTTEASKIVNEVGWKDGAPQLFYLYVVGLMIPAVLADAIFQAFSGELTDDEDDDGYLNDFLAMFFGSQYKTVTAMVPGGSIINAFTQFDKRYNSDKISVSPVVGAVENTAKAIPSVYKAVVEDGKAKPAIKNSLTAIQIISGLPVAPLGRPLGYLAEVSEGNEQPSGPVDFTRGLISGKSKPKD